ncbi:MAG: hypothetical protein D6739_00380 [Nitrospirae bacterium]|nr:MAG: hypothetical protein D6739_00380 [Nitrospirota bacterium]
MRRALAFLVGLAPLAAAPAWAAEGEVAQLFVRTVNFALAAAVLVWVFTRVFSLRTFFERRRGAIEDDLAQSARELQRAKERLAAIQERLRQQESEVAEILAEGEEEGRVEAERILAASREQAARIATQMQALKELQERRLAKEVREAVVSRAIAQAEALIAEAFTEEDHRRLVEEALS